MSSAHLRLSGVSAAIATAMFAAAPALAGPAYLKIGDIKGESTDDKHKGEIEVLSWSWGEARQGKNIRKQVGVASSDPEEGGEVVREPGSLELPNLKTRPTVSDMTIAKPVDKATARLAQPAPRDSLTLVVPAGTCVAGARYPTVTLRSDSETYELQDVTVASCAPATAAKKGKKGKKDQAQEYMTIKMVTILVSS